MTKKKRVLWFARGGDIARCGPFATQVEAVRAMRLATSWGPFSIRTASMRLTQRVPGQYDEFPVDVFVWPEEVER